MNTEIKTALSKLTIKEIELLNLTHLLPKNDDKKVVTLRIYYGMGDGDGSTHEDCTISKSNPFLKDILTILDKLPKDDFVFCYDDYKKYYIKGIFSKTEFQLMCIVSEKWDCYEDDFDESGVDYDDFYKNKGLENSNENSEYLWEFDRFYEDYEYTSLTYNGHEIR